MQMFLGQLTGYCIYWKIASWQGSVLKNHSIGEGELLYPKLIAAGDLEVCKIARKHFDENTCLMFEIGMHFDKWVDFEITEDNAKVFASEIRTIINSLIYRITMEDREIYPILDRLYG